MHNTRLRRSVPALRRGAAVSDGDRLFNAPACFGHRTKTQIGFVLRSGSFTLRSVARVIRASEVRGDDTVALARGLLGRLLVTRVDGRRLARRIVETEAYHGPEDRGSHARRGRTPRTEVMFGPGGTWYVYFIYGMYEMLNLVTGPRGHPAAILIRGLEGHSGPGRLTRAFGIDRRFNGLPATRASGLWLEDDGFIPSRDEIVSTPRIGIDYAGEEWAAKPWRFVWTGASGVTAPPIRPRRTRS